jgi:hypothetical protein
MGAAKKRKQVLGDKYGTPETSERNKYRNELWINEAISQEVMRGMIERGFAVDESIIRLPMITYLLTQVGQERITPETFFEKVERILILKDGVIDINPVEYHHEIQAVTDPKNKELLMAMALVQLKMMEEEDKLVGHLN